MTTTTPANAPRRRAIQDGLPSKLGAANTDTSALYPEFMYMRSLSMTAILRTYYVFMTNNYYKKTLTEAGKNA